MNFKNSICRNKDCSKCKVKCSKNQRWKIVPVVTIGETLYECPGCGYTHSMHVERGILNILHKCPKCNKELLYPGERKKDKYQLEY